MNTGVEQNPARLSAFIRDRRDDILDEWTRRVRTLDVARPLSQPRLIDHLPELLSRVADVIETARTGAPVFSSSSRSVSSGAAKARGRASGSDSSSSARSCAHIAERFRFSPRRNRALVSTCISHGMPRQTIECTIHLIASRTSIRFHAGTQMQRCDERELQFDVRCLDAGDRVEVFIDKDSGWTRGRFEISTAGLALILLTTGQEIGFDAALRMGLRRILN